MAAAQRNDLARRRAAMGFTQETLAEHLRVERSTVGRWERGIMTPQPWHQPALAKALGISRKALADLLYSDADNHAAVSRDGTMPDLDHSATVDRTIKPPPAPDAHTPDTELDVPWTAAGSLRILHGMTDSELMEPIGRRLFLSLTGVASTLPAHQWLIARTSTEVALTGSPALPVGIVDHLDTITAELRQMDDQMGGATLLEVVRVLVRQVVGLIENSRYPETVGRGLYATAAELLRLAGWSCFEANRHADAQRYWVGALHAAHTAGDRALGANILGFMSRQAVDLGQVRESVTLAETARAGYPGASPKITTLLNLRSAEAYALDGATTECRRALDTAFDRHGDAPASTGEPGWSYWVTEATAHAHAAACYMRLEDWDQARHHLSSALRLQGTSFARDGALRRIRLAETYLRQNHPDLDQALALGTDAVDALTGTVNSARCAKLLTPLVDGLAPYRTRQDVREFSDRASTVLTVGS